MSFTRFNFAGLRRAVACAGRWRVGGLQQPGSDELLRTVDAPAEAKFVDGVDGCVLLRLKARNADAYDIVVYLDSDSLAYRGPARPDPPNSRASIIE